MLVSPAPIIAYIVCFTYLDSSTIKSQLPELVHSFTGAHGTHNIYTKPSLYGTTKPGGMERRLQHQGFPESYSGPIVEMGEISVATEDIQ